MYVPLNVHKLNELEYWSKTSILKGKRGSPDNI